MRLGAVMLASGESARFARGNKLLAPFMGEPLIKRTFAALPPQLFTSRLVVTRSEEIATLAQGCGLRALLHSLPDISDTIRLGVKAMADTDGCLFCVGDQPFMSADTVSRIILAFRDEPTRICRAAFGGLYGSPVIFPKALYGELAALEPGQSGSAVIKRHAALVRAVEAGALKELMDIDTQEDHQRLEGEGNAASW